MVWIKLKQTYYRTKVIRLHYGTLSTDTGISHTSLRKHVKILVTEGLVLIDKRYLILKGINKLKNHPKATVIPIPVMQSKKEQVLRIREAIIRFNLDKQKAQIRNKNTIVNKIESGSRLTKHELKLVQKAGGTDKFARSIISYTTLSNKGFGKLFHLSKSSGIKIQKDLRDRKLIKSKTKLKLVGKVHQMDYALNYQSYVYNYTTGQLFRQQSNEITTPTISR